MWIIRPFPPLLIYGDGEKTIVFGRARVSDEKSTRLLGERACCGIERNCGIDEVAIRSMGKQWCYTRPWTVRCCPVGFFPCSHLLPIQILDPTVVNLLTSLSWIVLDGSKSIPYELRHLRADVWRCPAAVASFEAIQDQW